MKADEVLDELFERHGDGVPVEEFMREALYNPEVGYYRRGIEGVGPRGDFATSATLNRWLARAIAAWALDAMKSTGVRTIIEVGAGDGSLARDVLREIGWLRRRKMSYGIVEISEALRQTQRRNLSRFKVNWHGCMREALASCRGDALVISNELVDAFPCIRLVREGGGWKECVLQRGQGGSLKEVAGDLAGGRAAYGSVFSWEDVPEGQQVEVQAAYREWLLEWAPSLRNGRVLTIDYGDECPALYYRRPSGTLRAYRKHQRLTGSAVFENFGAQDLTVDVNFTDLVRWGGEVGWKLERVERQREFVGRNAPGAAADRTEGVAQWMEGAGAAFLVLEQSCAR